MQAVETGGPGQGESNRLLGFRPFRVRIQNTLSDFVAVGAEDFPVKGLRACRKLEQEFFAKGIRKCRARLIIRSFGRIRAKWVQQVVGPLRAWDKVGDPVQRAIAPSPHGNIRYLGGIAQGI
jgi:hypothetical protein